MTNNVCMPRLEYVFIQVKFCQVVGSLLYIIVYTVTTITEAVVFGIMRLIYSDSEQATECNNIIQWLIYQSKSGLTVTNPSASIARELSCTAHRGGCSLLGHFLYG